MTSWRKLMNQDFIRQSFERHRSEPEVSADKHIRRLTIALGESISNRQKLYLDTRYWIFLREAAIGRPRQPDHFELLELLRQAVHSGIALCPISDVGFLELMKQTDPMTKLETAKLVDELSLGVAFLTEETRVGTELAHMMHQDGGNQDVHPLAHLVWVRVCYVLGFIYPSGSLLDPSEDLVLQKAAIDCLWQTSLQDFVKTVRDKYPSSDSFEETAAKINVKSQEHAHEIRSFDQAFVAEIAGTLGHFKGTLADVLEHLYEKQAGIPAAQTAQQREVCEKQLLLAFINMFRYARQKMAQRVPTLYVHAMCHAASRWDRKKKLNGHDLLDFHHATAAVGYCKAFFTEKPLRALLTAGHVALDRKYGCCIVSEGTDATKYVRELISKQ